MSKHMPIEVYELVVDYRKQQFTFAEIARILKLPCSTVKLICSRYEKTRTFGRKIGSGRKPKIPKDDICMIRKLVENKPTMTSSEIKQVMDLKLKNVTCKTVRNALHAMGFDSCKAVKKPLLSKSHVESRLFFAEKNIYMEKDEWKKIIFSDETKFNLFGSDSPVKVWRKCGERLLEKNIQKTVKYNGGSMMFWGCFSYEGVGNLVFIDGIMDQFVYLNILKENLKESANKLNVRNFTFQQDNDPKHTSKL